MFHLPSTNQSSNIAIYYIKRGIQIILLLVAIVTLSACQGKTPSQPTNADNSTPPLITTSPTPLSPTPTTMASPTEAATPTNAQIMHFLADDDPYHGPQEAPVVIVEFSDYLCPFCGEFYLETLPQILETYPNEVRFVHRDLVFFGEESYRSALAAGCANEQGKFWELHDVLFSLYEGFDFSAIDHSQPPSAEDLAKFKRRYTEENLVKYAQSVDLDIETFTTCLHEERYQNEISYDYVTAQQLGIESAPTFIVNGRSISGFMPFEQFSEIIETALAEAHN